MGCSTSSANAVRNLDTESPETAANTAIETASNNAKNSLNMNGSAGTKAAIKNGTRKVSKSSINTLENRQTLAGITADDQTNDDDANKMDRLSLSSSSSSSDSDLDYSDIVDTVNGKQHRRKAGEWQSSMVTAAGTAASAANTNTSDVGQQDEIVVIHTNNADHSKQP